MKNELFRNLLIFGEDIRMNNITRLLKEDKPIVLFGASGFGITTYQQMNAYGIKVTCFCDNDIKKQGREILGLPVLSFSEVKKQFPGAFIIITVGVKKYVDEIVGQILQHYASDDYMCLDLSYLTKPLANTIVEENIKDIEEVYNLLEDDRSREVYISKINYIINGNSDSFIGMYDENQYFPKDILSIKEKEIFIDAGTFDGKTTEDFFGFFGKSAQKAYCFEPDPDNLAVARARLESRYNVDLIQAAVWSSDCNLKMSLSSSAQSSINDNGEGVVCARSVDSVLNGSSATFIKMDVEGAEYEALLGAENTIKRCEPVLAICIYHSVEDHWRLPLLIKKMNPNYKLYIRHYSFLGIETVCYAIPG